MTSIFETPTGILFFDELEGPAFPAIQTAYDRVKQGVGRKFIWSSFNKDMVELGYHRPTEKEMNRFASAVEAGTIARPERAGIEEEPEPEVDDAPDTVDEPATPVDQVIHAVFFDDPEKEVSTEYKIHGMILNGSAPEDQNASDTQAFAIALMMRDAKEDLQRDIEAQARKLVAERLRAMASTLEQG